MMQGVATFAMASRMRAILVAATCAMAALLLPPFTSPLSYLGGAVVALVALRLGAMEGFAVLVAGALSLAVVGALVGGLAIPLALGALLLWLPLWVFAVMLRHSRSLGLTLKTVALFGAAVVVALHVGLGTPVDWWQPRIAELLTPIFEAQGLDATPYVAELARWMTALIGAALVLSVLLSLLLGRAWQADLYNPGGFGTEFRALDLGRGFALLSLGVLALVMLPLGDGVGTLLKDLLPTLLVLYVLQGLAIVHAIVKHRQLKRGWLTALYVIVGLVPQALPILALLGWMESWINLRGRRIERS